MRGSCQQVPKLPALLGQAVVGMPLPSLEDWGNDPMRLQVADDIADVVAAHSNPLISQQRLAFDLHGPQGFAQHSNDQAAMPVAETSVERPVQVGVAGLLDGKAFVLADEQMTSHSEL